MRKGENKRQEILSAAEHLFCTRGYEATSVQDILDVLHASKGGFYHHFASKEELLKTLCMQRAERVLQYTKEQIESVSDNMARINAILYGFMPLRREEIPYLTMMLPVMSQPEGRGLAMVYQEALFDAFLPLLQEAVASATASGIICPPVRSMESPVLHMVSRCWLDATEHVRQCAAEGRRLDTGNLLSIVEKYRRSIEILLDAPYGSICIVRIEEWDEVSGKLLRCLENR